MKRISILPWLVAALGGAQMLGCVNAPSTVPPRMGLMPSAESGVGMVAHHEVHPVHQHLLAPQAPAPQHMPTNRQVLTTPITTTGPVTPLVAPELEARLLVIAADGNEAGLPAIRQALDYMGTPYDVWTAAERPDALTTANLANGDVGRYQGVILTTGNLAFFDGAGWRSALSPEEWQTLAAYEARFGVRQVTWYTMPAPEYGFGPATPVDTTTTPVATSLTAAGRAAFPYLSGDRAVSIRNAYTYLAAPADSTLTPLLTDASGHTLAGVKRYADGRENLALTFDGNPTLLHTLSLSYGVINWVTRGVFIGDRRVYMSAQVDDVLIADDMYSGGTFRTSAADWDAVVQWQTQRQQDPLMAGFRLDMAYNGVGMAYNGVDMAYNGVDMAGGGDNGDDLAADTAKSRVQANGKDKDKGTKDKAAKRGGKTPAVAKTDPLIEAVKRTQQHFKWIGHTYTHLNLNATDHATTMGELIPNLDVANLLKLTTFSRTNLVTPEISGLFNPEATRAMADAGVRFVVSDTSRPGQNNPAPNIGLYNPSQPGIFMIPRYPNNLFYNVATPTEWAAEYNSFHKAYWGRDLSYTEILDKESEVLVRYLLKGDMNPWMFHQPNLRAYDGRRTLLGDLIDATLAKYRAHVNLPILSPTQDQLGQRMVDRTRAVTANVRATVVPGRTITFTADRAATFTATGVRTTQTEVYGGQPIGLVTLQPGQRLTFSLQ